MSLPHGVHALSQTVAQADREVTIHPAAVETDRGLLLLDAGYPGEADQMESTLRDEGFGWDDVWAVLVTHQDGDHAGGLREVVDRSGAFVAAHHACAPYVDGREDPIKGTGDRYPPVPVDVELVDRVTFRTAAGPMRIVFTPGHAPGHVALHFPEAGFLVAADALTAQDGALAGPSERFTPDMAKAADSVGVLAGLDFDRTLCYHGGLVDDGAKAAADIHDSLVE
ncbi:MBL fold metallo-hydrolase [Halobacteriaceae archaeon GCM10025711]